MCSIIRNYPLKMSKDDIRNLSDLLAAYLGSSKEIEHTEITRLTAPGENFGSVMLRVDITLKTKNGTEERLHAVAKKLPDTELFRKLFNIQMTFRNEIAFYNTILPTLREFQKQNCVTDVLDCFAKLYGARISLDKNSSTVDEDAVLILENLIASGYANINRLEEFDLDGAKFLIRDLAHFHGITIALKLQRPEVFQEKIKVTCLDFKPEIDFATVCSEVIKEVLLQNPKCVHLIPKVTLWGQKPRPQPREPFATLAHCDMWVNNTLQKFENGKIIGNKFVDFQVYAYRSAVSDLFFFFWSSVRQAVLEKHLDYLLEYYHENLIDMLEKFKCDTKSFGYDKYLEEIRIEADFEFGHGLQFAAFVVNGPKGGSEMEEIPSKELLLKNVTLKAKEKIWYMVLECDKRGWLY